MNTKALRQKILDLAIHGKLVPPACRQAGKTLTTNPKPRIEGMKCWFTYVIECEDGSFYKGYTDDLLRRYRQHCNGTGAQYTKDRKPKQLYYWEMHYSEEAALEREKYLKSGVGREWFKKEVVDTPDDFEPASVLLQRIREEKERLIKEGKIKKGKKSAKTSDTAHYENVPFEVPESWEWCRLEDICSKFSTGPFGSMVHKSDYVTVDGIPMINPANITDGGISTEKVMQVSKSKAAELGRYKLCADDIILARRGDLSKCAIIKKEQVDFICGTGSFYLHLILMHPSYFKLFYNTSYVKSILETECVGATMSNLNQSVLGHLAIPLPPLAEQRRIVAEIERWFSLIDTIESGKASLQTAVKQAKNKILDLAIHGKLVPPVCRQAGKTPTDEPASELLRRINPKAEITSDNAHYQNLPSGWAVCRLEDIVSYEQPTAFIVNSTSYDDSYPTPVLTAGKSFIIGRTNETDGIYSKLPCIIFDDFTTDSKLVDFPFKVKSSAMKILQVSKGIEIEYVALFMSITRLIGDTHKRYWISEYSKLEIPLPPQAEQKRIIQLVKLIFCRLDSLTVNL